MTPLESSEVALQVVASPIIINLRALEVSFMLLENIYCTGITHDDHHTFYSTDNRLFKTVLRPAKFSN
jgi:hypothetical protein